MRADRPYECYSRKNANPDWHPWLGSFPVSCCFEYLFRRFESFFRMMLASNTSYKERHYRVADEFVDHGIIFHKNITHCLIESV